MKRIVKTISFIAHVDHGKSSLSKRILEFIGYKNISIDNLETEKKRGITIKSKVFTSFFNNYVLNILDTPGHIDFSYEVLRSIKVSDVVFLLIDIKQGIQSQTVKYLNMALNNNIKIIPILSKIDLINKSDLANKLFNIKKELQEYKISNKILKVSAKNNYISEVLDYINFSVKGKIINISNKNGLFYVFDSYIDKFLGTVAFIKVLKGSILLKQNIILSNKKFHIFNSGLNFLKRKQCILYKGDIGFINIRQNIYITNNIFKFDTKQQVFCLQKQYDNSVLNKVFFNLFPFQRKDNNKFIKVVNNLHINDPSFSFVKINSFFYGSGYQIKCNGFLHMEIIKERLLLEYNMKTEVENASVIFKVFVKNNKSLHINRASNFPFFYKKCEEMFCSLCIYIDIKFIKNVYQILFCDSKLILVSEKIINNNMILNCKTTFRFIINNFSDRLYSCTQGFGSFDYKFIGFQETQVGRLDVIINNELVNGFSFIIDVVDQYIIAKKILKKLLKFLKPRIVLIKIYIKFNNKIILGSKIKSKGKIINIKSKGDYSRVLKLFRRQKIGKKKLLNKVKINIPFETLKKIYKSLN